jgi:hypothetical protein
MSDYEYKMVLRLMDENISSKREHLAWMRQITRHEPVWVEGEAPKDSMEFNFSYMQLNEDGTRKQHLPTGYPSNAYLCDVSDGKFYGVDLVVAWTVGEPPMASLHSRDMERLLHEICNVTNADAAHVRYLFYGWFNGGDEPIEW